MPQKGEHGQAMAEFALMIPVLILLLFGMTFAAFYAFRSAAVDWGVFVTGVATGSYNTPATLCLCSHHQAPDHPQGSQPAKKHVPVGAGESARRVVCHRTAPCVKELASSIRCDGWQNTEESRFFLSHVAGHLQLGQATGCAG